MGRYLNTLIERESLLNEISENHTSLNTREGNFVDIPTSTSPQKVQKVENFPDIPTPTHFQKVQKPPDDAPSHRWASAPGDDPTGPASAAAPPTARDESPDVASAPTFAAPDELTAPGVAATTTGSAAAPDVPVWAAPGLTRQQQWRAARLDGQRQARERRAIEAQSTD
jgi:hypothetical protein